MNLDLSEEVIMDTYEYFQPATITCQIVKTAVIQNQIDSVNTKLTELAYLALNIHESEEERLIFNNKHFKIHFTSDQREQEIIYRLTKDLKAEKQRLEEMLKNSIHV